MQPLDEGYMKRREEQIKEMYMLGANTWATLIVGVVLTAIGLFLMNSGYKAIGTGLFVVSLLFEIGTVFMFASYFALRSTHRAIQHEYEMLARYGEKPKRNGAEQAVRLTDDGELIDLYELDEAARRETYSEQK